MQRDNSFETPYVLTENDIRELRAIKNSRGGLFTDQVQLALKHLFKDKPTVHVPLIDEFLDRHINLPLAKLYDDGIRYVAFTFMANAIHQVAVWIELDEPAKLTIFNSRQDTTWSPINTQRLHTFISAELKDAELKNGVSPFYSQKDQWACGVFVIAHLLHAASDESSNTPYKKSRLDVDQLLEDYYVASMEGQRELVNDETTSHFLQAERIANARMHLLNALGPDKIFEPLTIFLTQEKSEEHSRKRPFVDSVNSYQKNLMAPDGQKDRWSANQHDWAKFLLRAAQVCVECNLDELEEKFNKLISWVRSPQMQDIEEVDKTYHAVNQRVGQLNRVINSIRSREDLTNDSRNLLILRAERTYLKEGDIGVYYLKKVMDAFLPQLQTEEEPKGFVRRLLNIILSSSPDTSAILKAAMKFLNCEEYWDYPNYGIVFAESHSHLLCFLIRQTFIWANNLDLDLQVEKTRVDKARIDREEAQNERINTFRQLLSQYDLEVDNELIFKVCADQFQYVISQKYTYAIVSLRMKNEKKLSCLYALASITNRNITDEEVENLIPPKKRESFRLKLFLQNLPHYSVEDIKSFYNTQLLNDKNRAEFLLQVEFKLPLYEVASCMSLLPDGYKLAVMRKIKDRVNSVNSLISNKLLEVIPLAEEKIFFEMLNSMPIDWKSQFEQEQFVRDFCRGENIPGHLRFSLAVTVAPRFLVQDEDAYINKIKEKLVYFQQKEFVKQYKEAKIKHIRNMLEEDGFIFERKVYEALIGFVPRFILREFYSILMTLPISHKDKELCLRNISDIKELNSFEPEDIARFFPGRLQAIFLYQIYKEKDLDVISNLVGKLLPETREALFKLFLEKIGDVNTLSNWIDAFSPELHRFFVSEKSELIANFSDLMCIISKELDPQIKLSLCLEHRFKISSTLDLHSVLLCLEEARRRPYILDLLPQFASEAIPFNSSDYLNVLHTIPLQQRSNLHILLPDLLTLNILNHSDYFQALPNVIQSHMASYVTNCIKILREIGLNLLFAKYGLNPEPELISTLALSFQMDPILSKLLPPISGMDISAEEKLDYIRQISTHISEPETLIELKRIFPEELHSLFLSSVCNLFEFSNIIALVADLPTAEGQQIVDQYKNKMSNALDLYHAVRFVADINRADLILASNIQVDNETLFNLANLLPSNVREKCLLHLVNMIQKFNSENQEKLIEICGLVSQEATIRFIQALLNKGADLSELVLEAIKLEDIEFISIVLNKFTNYLPGKKSPLFVLAEENQVSMLRKLLIAGADIYIVHQLSYAARGHSLFSKEIATLLMCANNFQLAIKTCNEASHFPMGNEFNRLLDLCQEGNVDFFFIQLNAYCARLTRQSQLALSESFPVLYNNLTAYASRRPGLKSRIQNILDREQVGSSNLISFQSSADLVTCVSSNKNEEIEASALISSESFGDVIRHAAHNSAEEICDVVRMPLSNRMMGLPQNMEDQAEPHQRNANARSGRRVKNIANSLKFWKKRADKETSQNPKPRKGPK